MGFAEIWSTYIWPLVVILAQSVVLLVALLIYIAFILLADRKIWAAVQMRRGPNVVGPWGLLQSFADFLKFVMKEPVIPSGANKGVFLLAPLVTCVLALSAWAVIPLDHVGRSPTSMSAFSIFSPSPRSWSTA
jgi:NADH-quinone oxidoreductase subunit H